MIRNKKVSPAMDRIAELVVGLTIGAIFYAAVAQTYGLVEVLLR